MPYRADLPVFETPPATLAAFEAASARAAASPLPPGTAGDDEDGRHALLAHQAALLATPARVRDFMKDYRLHSLALIDAVCSQRVDHIESLLKAFWATQWENRAMFANETLVGLIVMRDSLVYATLAQKLLPNVLHALPISVAALLKDYTRQLSGWLESALVTFPVAFQQAKIGTARVAAASLFKQASLNHLAQAARSVLANEAQLRRMRDDLGDVDVQALQQQASLVCSCPDSVVLPALTEVYCNIEGQLSLERWADWLHSLVRRLAGDQPLADFFPNFYLKWSLYGSLLVRHLTIKNAVSFGSFHLLRTLFDDYLLYVLEQHRAGRDISVAVTAAVAHEHGSHQPPTAQVQHVPPPPPPPPVVPLVPRAPIAVAVAAATSTSAAAATATAATAASVTKYEPMIEDDDPAQLRGSMASRNSNMSWPPSFQAPHSHRVRAGTPKNTAELGSMLAGTASTNDLHAFAPSPSPTPFRSTFAPSPALGLDGGGGGGGARSSLFTSPPLIGSGAGGTLGTLGTLGIGVGGGVAGNASVTSFSPFVEMMYARDTPFGSMISQPSPVTMLGQQRSAPPQFGVPEQLSGMHVPKPRAAASITPFEGTL
jgi:hypothetical protein